MKRYGRQGRRDLYRRTRKYLRTGYAIVMDSEGKLGFMLRIRGLMGGDLPDDWEAKLIKRIDYPRM